MVYGPAMHAVFSLEKLNASSADIYRLIDGSSKDDVPQTSFFAFCDARDVGEAHVRGYEVPEAANQRYLCAAGNYTLQQVCEIIRKDFPEKRDLTPDPTKTSGLKPGEYYGLDKSKIQKELGIKFRSLETTIHDQVAELINLEKRLGKS